MKALALAAFLISTSASFAAEAPKLLEKDLVPGGFLKSAEAKGDLNADGISDIALLLRQGGADAPQSVLLYLGDKAGKYTLWKTGATHFIEANPNLMEENGVGTFEIKKGVLIIASSTAMSMGGWSAGGCTQKWRKDKSGFRLIGLTMTDIDRKCACGSTTDMNLLTGLSITSTDRDENGGQMEKESVTKTKGKPKVVFWEDFVYDESCAME